ncbi:MAG: phosphoribosylglycinamide formyltransferase [Candidatus Cloacimonadota bacterium]|nr:MAG: phosphoribosylglycinamide formyltransferase [Candidatus Cloacimonadota bacterium]
MKKFAVITSGKSRGSNFEAIMKKIKESGAKADCEFVVITKKSAPIKEKCEFWKVPYKFISARNLSEFEDNLLEEIKKNKIDLVVLAGFMKKISAKFIERAKVPVINIHPALLPAYGGKGMFGSAVHKAVFEAGEKISGVTVHYINENYDEGAIIKQKETDISDCSSAEEIAAKVLKLEHSVYGEVIIDLLKEDSHHE